MRVLMATDAFPPGCGGSGWSTYELARGLRDRGHEMTIVMPRVGTTTAGPERDAFDGFRPVTVPAFAPRVPYVRNYFKNELLYARLAAYLGSLIHDRAIDVVHAQHVLTGPPAVAAAHQIGRPVVCTVRDYWPVCYWSDLIYDRHGETLCTGCTPGMMTRCVRPRAGALWPLAVPMIPYMRANLAAKRRSLARADAVVAVSSAVARDLRARAPEVRADRIVTIPNPVDVAGLREQAERQPRPLEGHYALYVGKLEPNKGVAKLPIAVARAKLDWPLVIVGDGSERAGLEAIARRGTHDTRFVGWLPRERALGWVRHASMLVFPSKGPESCSRVLLEASALGVAIAANDTGGTGDIVTHGETGLLSRTADGLGDDVARLRRDDGLRRQLGAAAQRAVGRGFDTPAIAAQIEALYTTVSTGRAHRR